MGGEILDRQKSVEFLLSKGVLISPSVVEKINSGLISQLKPLLEKGESFVLDEAFLQGLSQAFNVEILRSYNEPSSNRDVEDFVAFFNSRFKQLSNLLIHRPEMSNKVSISRLVNKSDREAVSIIGLVSNIAFTKNNNIKLTLEDPTGSIGVIVTKRDTQLFRAASSLTLDEVIGVSGTNGKNILFASSITWPGIPLIDLKKSPLQESAIVLSDLHVGSKNFLEKEFKKFLSWINGRLGSEAQVKLANKVKYIFIVGDLVDGVGIYPGQYNELEIKDIYKQYEMCAELLSQIPQDKAIIICPGNHDALRLAEPQPPLSIELASPLYKLPNVIMVSNPARVNIGRTGGFEGFDVLLYHGYSFDYYVANIESIRNSGGYNNPELILKYLLQRRHLAPSHGSTLYVPTNIDPLVIEKIPDMFFTGHIHKSALFNHRNITLVSGSCWQSKTSFQEKVGHEPEPCRVPIIDLHTRKMRLLNFGG